MKVYIRNLYEDQVDGILYEVDHLGQWMLTALSLLNLTTLV